MVSESARGPTAALGSVCPGYVRGRTLPLCRTHRKGLPVLFKPHHTWIFQDLYHSKALPHFMSPF